MSALIIFIVAAAALLAGAVLGMLVGHIRAAQRIEGLRVALTVAQTRLEASVLADQDRAQWSRELITEGTAVLDAAVQRRSPGPYQLQAAIAALHAQAPSFEETDWAQIAALYGELARRSPSPVVEVNRAVAVGIADGPLAGLAVLQPVLASGELTGYAPLHTAHADLLDRAGRAGEATAAWARAIEATDNEVLRVELQRRAAGRRDS